MDAQDKTPDASSMPFPLFHDGILSMRRFEYPSNSKDEMSIEVLAHEISRSHTLLHFMKSIKQAARILATSNNGMFPIRIAFLYAGIDDIRLIPIYIESSEAKTSVAKKWKAIRSEEEPAFYNEYPGFITSVDGPPASVEDLDKVQSLFLRDRAIKSEPHQEYWSYHFDGNQANDNLFAKLVRGEIQQWRIWESETHVAFLTPYPNSLGCSVLIPRKHMSSDVFALEDDDYEALIRATEIVTNLIQQTFNKYNYEISESGCDCYDVGIIFEGFEIDYTHVKLYPMIRTNKKTVQSATNKTEETSNTSGDIHEVTGTCMETYQGHVTSKFGLHRRFDSNIHGN